MTFDLPYCFPSLQPAAGLPVRYPGCLTPENFLDCTTRQEKENDCTPGGVAFAFFFFCLFPFSNDGSWVIAYILLKKSPSSNHPLTKYSTLRQ
ncbi:hypothetical protein BO86DRAFT_28343 [Aspergillus japonicus CBS 114.51]|uniref:Uncharacterized protein n=1 Tax=Aspergillus japonicus CBS 114.51 TaxID=1448312 RepID=A0A8T8WKA9_ASPJA|nr:hypothetical protein BO86DRAFT_28343 [Aspergillus japonicus CBS 114.51]RAH76153.1 hypothetical protein BO86DRAFT_28343 [Aspergillus japonicus CBS 114.51]